VTQTRIPSISTMKITQCDRDTSRRRAQKQHATVTRRLRTVMATSYGDGNGDFARWQWLLGSRSNKAM